jgi:hypothetical protein
MSTKVPLCHFERSEKSRPSAHGNIFPSATGYRKKEETSRYRTRFLTTFEMTRGALVGMFDSLVFEIASCYLATLWLLASHNCCLAART